MPRRPIYEFAPFRYDANQRVLYRGADLVALGPKTIDTLHALLERHGEVVTKAVLMEQIWPDTTVEDIGLARNISLLRKALGDDDDEPRYIATVARRGYRFLAPVSVILPDAEGAQQPAVDPVQLTPAPRLRHFSWRWIAAAVAFATLLAVVYWQFYVPSRFVLVNDGAYLATIPFDSLTPQPGDLFSRGLDEALVSELTKYDVVQVLSPATVRRYRGRKIPSPLMARIIGLDVLIEGTLQQTGEQLRVTARMADVHTGRLIWAAAYDRPLSDQQEAQRGIARDIAAAAAPHLAVHRRPKR